MVSYDCSSLHKVIWVQLHPGEVDLPGGWPEAPDPHGDGVQTRAPQQPRHRGPAAVCVPERIYVYLLFILFRVLISQ